MSETGVSALVAQSRSTLARVGRMVEPFEWDSSRRRGMAMEHLEAAVLSADMGELGQTKLQLHEVLKLTFVDHLGRHGIDVRFGAALSKSCPLNTGDILLSPEVFEHIHALEAYPYQGVFGETGLDLGSVRVAERKGGCELELRFWGEVCTVKTNSLHAILSKIPLPS